MVNKRLLIKNLLSHNDENSFYDKKMKVSLDTREGKAKFIKHVCALSNSNPDNSSFIIIGVKDANNEIVGVDFFDDSKIQNLINAYVDNPPKIAYENVPFPRLPRYKVVGLVTIYPKKKISRLSRFIWKYPYGTIFYRRGSTSQPLEGKLELKNNNKAIVEAIEKNARNNIQLTLDAVFDFVNNHKEEYTPQYKVFKEQFVLCWAGKKENNSDKELYSRVDIELINEQVRLFYSALDEVEIKYNSNSFIVTEYIKLGLNSGGKHYPLEKTIISFKDNGKHDISKEYLFQPPLFDSKLLAPIFKRNNEIIRKLKTNEPLSEQQYKMMLQLPTNYLICYLNGFLEAKEQLEKAKKHLKALDDKTTYIKYKEVMRVLRKVNYH